MFGLTPYRRNSSIDRRPGDLFDIESLFGDFFNESLFSAFGGSNQMKVDIKENEKEYVVEAELPGIKKEELVVDLKDDRLTISVERNEQVNEEKESYIRRERRYGAVSRSFMVPNILRENASAKFESGILTVVLPKRDQIPEKSTKIDIN